MVRMSYDGAMARPLTKTKRFEMRLTPEDDALFDRLTERTGLSRAGVASLAIRSLAKSLRVKIPEVREALAAREGE